MVEAIIAAVIVLIAISMSFVIATVVNQNAVNGTAKSVASSAGQQALVTLDPYLRSATAGQAAETASGGLTLCNGQSGAFTRILDYSVELCTQRPASSACSSATATAQVTSCPQLFLIEIDPSTCTGSSCSLVVTDRSAIGSPVVERITPVRCDASCQADISCQNSSPTPFSCAGPTGTMPRLFTYRDASGAATTAAGSVASLVLDLEILQQGHNGTRWSEIRDQVTPPAALEPSL